MARSAYEFFESEQSRVVEFCRRNDSVSAFIQGVLEHCVQYCNQKEVPFEHVVLETPFVGDDEYFRARLRVK
jgi:hypothetical protein